MDRPELIRLMAQKMEERARMALSPAGAILPLAGVKLTPCEMMAHVALDVIEAAGGKIDLPA